MGREIGVGVAGQVMVRAVSSMTNEVCFWLSSVPVNLIVTVCPAKVDALRVFGL